MTEPSIHKIPDEYTELACLLGFVRRVAERLGNTATIALCDLADRGHPGALSQICAMFDVAAIAALAPKGG